MSCSSLRRAWLTALCVRLRGRAVSVKLPVRDRVENIRNCEETITSSIVDRKQISTSRAMA